MKWLLPPVLFFLCLIGMAVTAWSPLAGGVLTAKYSPDAAERARQPGRLTTTGWGNLFLTAPSLSQHAGLVAFDCREELEGHVAAYAHNRELMLAALPKMGLTRIAPPDGAFYIYADVGHLTDDSLAFCTRLLEETGVATAPGIDFDPVDGGRFVRFSFAVSTAEVEEALSRLGPWLERQRR